MTKHLIFVGLLAAGIIPSVAHAASGHITGTWRNYQNQGNYCDPDTRNCTHSRYLKTEYQTYHAISDTKIYVKDQDGVVIGTGATNANGYFDIVWNRASTPSSVRVFWQFEHKDDRFKIRGETNGVLAKWTDPVAVSNGGTISVGTLYAGTSTAISGLANVYDGADRMWYDALNYSGRMRDVFTGLTIRAFPDDCPTGCANSGQNLVRLPPSAAYKPQARILHEMGHIAAGKAAGAGMDPGSYCYPSETPSDLCDEGWSSTSAEWRGVALKEGMATFFGDVALYWNGAIDPRTCNSDAECAASGSLETSAVCSGTVGRTAIQMNRYFWDTYDDQADGNDNVAEPYYAFFDTLAAIPAGTSWGQKSSYKGAGSTIDSWDSFHSWEWHNALLNHWSGASETEDIYFQNCMGQF